MVLRDILSEDACRGMPPERTAMNRTPPPRAVSTSGDQSQRRRHAPVGPGVRQNGVEGPGVWLGGAAFPCAGRCKPPQIYSGGTATVGQLLAVIRGAERHRDLLVAEAVDGLEASLNRKLGGVSRAERGPPGLNRLWQTDIAAARATVDRHEIVSNGFGGQVQLSRRGLAMRCEAGHDIEDDTVHIESH
jgi:hypothetical protein